MAERLKLKAGAKVSSPSVLYEGYETGDNQITANVGIDKIESVLQHFIVMHKEPMFFILELPANADDETEIEPGVSPYMTFQSSLRNGACILRNSVRNRQFKCIVPDL